MRITSHIYDQKCADNIVIGLKSSFQANNPPSSSKLERAGPWVMNLSLIISIINLSLIISIIVNLSFIICLHLAVNLSCRHPTIQPALPDLGKSMSAIFLKGPAARPLRLPQAVKPQLGPTLDLEAATSCQTLRSMKMHENLRKSMKICKICKNT